MKKLLLLLFAISLSIIGLTQNTSPLKTVNFHKIPNDIADLKALKDAVGRDTDLDGNKAALIIVKTQGFSQKALLDFNYYTRGIEMIHHKIENGELWWYVGSNSNGSIIIKYMGEYEFKIPQKLEAKSVYELILGMETATLVINALPTNAEIFIDNEKVGTGYASKAVSIGAEHRYKVQCNNYRPSEDVVYFEKREKKELNVNLEPNFSYITIKTEPSGADIYVDGTKVGETPYMSEPIAFGQHRVELRKTGYEKYAKVVIIKPEELENTQLENVKLIKDPNYKEQQVAVNIITPANQNAQSTQIVQSTQMTPTTSSASSNHAFSVSATKKVNFSKGNLQYQASTKTWRFAEHQWDMIGEANKNISSSYSGWIDLFGWGTGNNPAKSSTSNRDYKNFRDWGNNSISNGGDRNWFTLTKDEWVYVFDKRSTSSGIRYAIATVNGVNGVILLPDTWNSSNYSLSKTNKSDASFGSNQISQSDWTSKLEANGAVFLPAAGWRYGTTVYSVGSGGEYWSATYYHSDRAYLVYFYDGNLYAGWGYRGYGRSVRLVSLAE